MTAAQPAWTRHGTDPAQTGPALICMNGAGESGKTRLACCAPRACPEKFGENAVYIAIDPEAAALGPVLAADIPNLEKVTLDMGKDLFQQLKSIYRFNWRAEGFETVITDTMTVFSQALLAQIADSGKFSDKHISLGDGVNAPMPGDYGGAQTLIMSLLRYQHQSGMNHICLFHDQEVRPEPGEPGEPIGGPATVGKASVRSIVNWYNTVLHVVKRPKKRTDMTKPQEMERVVYTSGHGIWQAKFRTRNLTNPIPEILMEPDPINVWQTLVKTQETN